MILPFIQDFKIAHNVHPITQEGEPKTPEPDNLDYGYENSFESKYLHFKERIEKDRLTWEILASKK